MQWNVGHSSHCVFSVHGQVAAPTSNCSFEDCREVERYAVPRDLHAQAGFEHDIFEQVAIQHAAWSLLIWFVDLSVNEKSSMLTICEIDLADASQKQEGREFSGRLQEKQECRAFAEDFDGVIRNIR